ncbi:MAG TPA: protein kinase [Pirellulaceae bacterium]|nr:protein kinase [Pirellulaceae bacterium]
MPDETQSLMPPDSSPEERLDQLLAEYLRQVEQGIAVDQQALLAAHPDLADDLREFFGNQMRMQRLVGETPPQGSRNGTAPTRLRYFGDYEILDEIAHGGMGVVYKARQTSLNRIVAVKMILAGQLANESDVKRFQAEAEAAANLHHPGIVGIYEVGMQDGQHYYSMEYIDGKNLAQIVRERPLPIATAAECVRDIATVLKYAHEQKVLHRDLKPSNILLDAHGRVRITDFGLAKRVEGESDLTMTGQILGTPSYMSPEQAAAQHAIIGPSTDIYALGAILYELITGRPPFRSENVAETLRQVQHDEPVRPRLLNPKLPRDLETICLKCLEKEPRRRYGSAQLLAEDLGRFLRGEPILARPISRPARAWRWCKRNPAAAGFLFASSVALLALVGVAVGQYYNAQLETANASLTTVNAQLGTANNSLETTTAKLQTTLQAVQTEKAEADRQRLRADDLNYAVSMALADRARVGGNSALAINLLERFRLPNGTRDQRGFEWHYLWRACYGHMPLLRGPFSAGTRVAFSSDGRHLATSSKENTITIWDSASGKLVHTLREFPTAAIAYSADGKVFAAVGTVGSKKMVKVWDIATNRETSSSLEASANVTCMACSSDGKKVAFGSNQAIYVSDIGATEPSITLAIPGRSLGGIGSGTSWSAIQDVAFSPDGNALAVAHESKVEVWNLETKTIALTHEDGHMPGPRRLTFGRNGDLLAVPASTTVKLVQVKTGKVVFTAKATDTMFASTVAFSPDGLSLLTPTRNGMIKTWEIDNGRELLTIPGWAPNPSALAFSPDGSQLAVARSSPAEVKVISLVAPREAATLPAARAHHSLAFSSDGKWLAAPGPQDTVEVWDVAGWQKALSLSGQKGNALDVAFSPDCRWLAASTRSGATVWRLKDGQTVFTVPAKGWLARVGFSPDGKLLATAGFDKLAQFWEVPSWKEVRSLKGLTGHPNATAFSPESQRFACAGNDVGAGAAGINIWNVSTGLSELQLLGHADRVYTVAFSPNGRLLASASLDRTLKVWDAANGKVVWTLHGHASSVNAVAFSPDGRRLASGSDDRTIKVWDIATGQELLTIAVQSGRPGRVFAVAFSPDNRHIASTGDDGLVRIWDGTPIKD